MKMTKIKIEKLLDAEYMDALAGFASYIAEKDDPETALEKLDARVWEIASEMDRQEEWLLIYSALLCGI